MKRMLQAGALVVALANAQAQPEYFAAYLYPANVVPPSASRAIGSTSVTLDGDTVGFAAWLALPIGGTLPSSIGIYGPAGRGTNGSMIGEWQLSELEPHGGGIVYYGEHTLAPEQSALLRAGLLYLLVRSVAYPDGELRGQICPLTPESDCDFDGVPNRSDLCPDTAPTNTVDANGCSSAQSHVVEFRADINGGNVVPPTTSRGIGEGSFTLVGDLFGYSAAIPLVSGWVWPSRIGIFGPADRGTNGPLIVEFSNYQIAVPLDGVGGAIYYRGAHPLTPEEIAQLNAGLWYVLLESDAYPNGEIRGQIVAEGSDSDRDGVPDIRDQCPNTRAGSVVNHGGCSIEQLCPCNGPWRNHGEYVNCVRGAANDFSDAGLTTKSEKRQLLLEASKSDCGRR